MITDGLVLLIVFFLYCKKFSCFNCLHWNLSGNIQKIETYMHRKVLLEVTIIYFNMAQSYHPSNFFIFQNDVF